MKNAPLDVKQLTLDEKADKRAFFANLASLFFIYTFSLQFFFDKKSIFHFNQKKNLDSAMKSVRISKTVNLFIELSHDEGLRFDDSVFVPFFPNSSSSNSSSFLRSAPWKSSKSFRSASPQLLKLGTERRIYIYPFVSI